MKDKRAERDNLHAQQQAAMLHESLQQQQQQQSQLMQPIQLQNAALMSLLCPSKNSHLLCVRLTLHPELLFSLYKSWTVNIAFQIFLVVSDNVFFL